MGWFIFGIVVICAAIAIGILIAVNNADKAKIAVGKIKALKKG